MEEHRLRAVDFGNETETIEVDAGLFGIRFQSEDTFIVYLLEV